MDIAGDETAYGRSKLLPIVGHSATLGNVWKLDPFTAKSPLRGLLPYNKVVICVILVHTLSPKEPYFLF